MLGLTTTSTRQEPAEDLVVNLTLGPDLIPSHIYKVMSGSGVSYRDFISDQVTISAHPHTGICAVCFGSLATPPWSSSTYPAQGHGVLENGMRNFAYHPHVDRPGMKPGHRRLLEATGRLPKVDKVPNLIASTTICSHQFHMSCFDGRFWQGTGNNWCPDCGTEFFTHMNDFHVADLTLCRINNVKAGLYDGSHAVRMEGLFSVLANALKANIVIIASALRDIHGGQSPTEPRVASMHWYSLFNVEPRHLSLIVEAVMKAVEEMDGEDHPIKSVIEKMKVAYNAVTVNERYPCEVQHLRSFGREVVMLSLNKVVLEEGWASWD